MHKRTRLLWAGLVLLVLGGAAIASYQSYRKTANLSKRIAGIATPKSPAVPCATEQGRVGRSVLILGQSNGGNHARPPSAEPNPPVFRAFYDGQCYNVTRTLPGGTGLGVSLFSFASILQGAPPAQSPLLITLAVDSTPISDWITDTPMQRALIKLATQLAQATIQPTVILWQHGENDTRAGMPAAVYEAGLLRLRAQLDDLRLTAPLVAARSTRCRHGQGEYVREAIDKAAQAHARIIVGPDFDDLAGAYRVADCHFSASGAQAAGDRWSLWLARYFAQNPGTAP
jgi:hypothetical protein